MTLIERVGRALPRPLHRSLWCGWDLVHGRWPRALADRTLARAARDPITFNQKVLHRMAVDRRPLLRTFADKVAVRTYVADRLGSGYLAECFGVYEAGGAISWGDLPRQFACKTSHASGGAVLVWEGAPRVPLPSDASKLTWPRLLLHPEDLVREDLARLCDGWLSLNYEYCPGRFPEWAYRDIPPRILIEELLVTRGGLPSDHRFFVFDGRCALVVVDRGRFEHHERDVFTPGWDVVPVSYGYPRPSVPSSRPEHLETMIAVAEALGAGVDFVRVDLYDVDGRIVVGELTIYPRAGKNVSSSASFDRWLAAQWTLPGGGSELPRA